MPLTAAWARSPRSPPCSASRSAASPTTCACVTRPARLRPAPTAGAARGPPPPTPPAFPRVGVGRPPPTRPRRTKPARGAPRPDGGGRPPAVGPERYDELRRLLAEQPDLTLDQLRQRLGLGCSLAAISRA